MIYIGVPDKDKQPLVESYMHKHGLKKVVLIYGQEAPYYLPNADRLPYAKAINYVPFYRLLQEIDSKTVLVIDECLRTQNRYDLTYNCIRHYINRTPHVIVFQLLPQIDTSEDFMILFDFVTGSQWKRREFDPELFVDVPMEIYPLPLSLEALSVPTSKKTQAHYTAKRDKLFAELGARDPHIIPRNLYLLGGEDKKRYIQAHSTPLFGTPGTYVARSKRLGTLTYADVSRSARATTQPPRDYTLVELPHRFIDLSDYLYRSYQFENRVLVADLKVDHWYYRYYTEWIKRIQKTYSLIGNTGDQSD